MFLFQGYIRTKKGGIELTQHVESALSQRRLGVLSLSSCKCHKLANPRGKYVNFEHGETLSMLNGDACKQ